MSNPHPAKIISGLEALSDRLRYATTPVKTNGRVIQLTSRTGRAGR
jgi:hypothetical protein